MSDKQIEKQIIEKTITEINKNNVRKIRSECFYKCTSLTSVSFPNATNIEANAFSNCTSLTLVSFPNVTNIESYAFGNCTSLTSVAFPNVTNIESRVFYDCTSLTSVSFPNATNIEANAFFNCRNLISAFPNAIIVGNGAFHNTDRSNTVEIHFYNKLTSLGTQGKITTDETYYPPSSIYLHYEENDQVLFTPGNLIIDSASSKYAMTYNIFTNNSIIKDGVLSKASEYVTVNVKHLDGSDW